jgi:hypothetical protein
MRTLTLSKYIRVRDVFEAVDSQCLTIPSDIDAQIERCHERIKAGIMPSIFEARLKDYLVRKYEREYVSTTI